MEPFKTHVERLLNVLSEKGLKAIAVFSPANVFYFSGSDAPSAALIFEDGRVVLLASRLEYLRAVEERALGEVFAYTRSKETAEYERTVEGDIYEVVRRLTEGVPPDKIGVAGASADVKRKLAEKLGVEPPDVSKEVVLLRRQKDSFELSRIEAAVKLAEQAMRRAVDTLDRGVREYEVVAEVLHLLLRSGASPSFDPIVAFGEHAAHPHAKPSSRELREGDVVKIDLGARVAGYCSDLTRTFVFGKPSQKQERIIKAVLKAQEKALSEIQAGVSSKVVHEAAYQALKEEGLHVYFNHGLGHGVGIEIHEEPYLNAESEAVLMPGDVVTVEPGVYMVAYLGVRVEDMVLVESGGAKELTLFPKDYLI